MVEAAHARHVGAGLEQALGLGERLGRADRLEADARQGGDQLVPRDIAGLGECTPCDGETGQARSAAASDQGVEVEVPGCVGGLFDVAAHGRAGGVQQEQVASPVPCEGIEHHCSADLGGHDRGHPLGIEVDEQFVVEVHRAVDDTAQRVSGGVDPRHHVRHGRQVGDIGRVCRGADPALP